MAYSQSVQEAISRMADYYALPARDRRLTLARILGDPLTSIGKSSVAQHLITLAEISGVDKIDPVLIALQEAKSYLGQNERWR